MNYELIVILNNFIIADSVIREPFTVQLGQERDVNQVALNLLSDLHIRWGFRVNATVNSRPIIFPCSQRPKESL